MSRLETARRLAGVNDPTWSPPKAPEDQGLKGRTFDWDRTDWPRWLTSPNVDPIGSRWRLTCDATIVAPELCAYPTLALVESGALPTRYRIAAGTRLTLVETFDPRDDEQTAHLDMISYYQWADGWASRTYQVDEGPSAGLRLAFSSDARGSRFPFSSRLAHAAIVPADDDETRDQQDMPGLNRWEDGA